MNIRPKADSHVRVHTDALNDVLFILLFFFLIVATLANPNVIKLMNPKANSETKVNQTVVVSIDAQQQFFVNAKPISDQELMEAIQVAIQDAPSDKEPSIVINADKLATADQIVAVMRAAQQLKVKTVLAVDKQAE
jgi:biopolymer transport protein ExbD